MGRWERCWTNKLSAGLRRHFLKCARRWTEAQRQGCSCWTNLSEVVLQKALLSEVRILKTLEDFLFAITEQQPEALQGFHLREMS
jgi:hypothetical protein